MGEQIIYMDHAATSWPKPAEVFAAMSEVATIAGGNPGRGGHRLALWAGESLFEARETVAEFFGCDDPFRVAFTLNVTTAINLVIKGFLKEGDHVLVSPLEHNAVMRPLHHAEQKGISWDVLPARPDGRVLLSRLREAIRPNTKLIILCHESNVNGVIQPVREVGSIAKANGIYLMVDCAQSAGSHPIHIEDDRIDFLAFTGHKGLYGPMGTGGLIFGKRVEISAVTPLIRGGTGSLSESFDQPEFIPDRFESGTQNVVGLAGLSAGIRWLKANQMIEREQREIRSQMMRVFIGLLRQIDGIHIYSAASMEDQGNVISLTVNGVDNGIAAAWLDREYGILSRIGLHCAPLAHQAIKTFPAGTIRFSISARTTIQEIETCVAAVNTIASNPGLVLKVWENQAWE